MKMRIKIIPTCPLCGQKRNVGAINSFIGKKVQRTYFCTSCMVEFNLAGTLFPPIGEEKKDLSECHLIRSSIRKITVN